MPDKVRIDKWLHAVKLYKSRTNATTACDGGKVKINGVAVKPSRQVETGETIMLKKHSSTFTYKILKIIEKRAGATVAQQCYEDLTPIEEKQKTVIPSAFINFESREKGVGRPTKRDRREIEQLKQNTEDWWEKREEDDD